MKMGIFLILFFLYCCSSWDEPPLTDEEIFSSTEKCKSFGLKTRAFKNHWTNTYIYHVQCSNELYEKKETQNINKVCIDGYKYIKNSNGNLTQMFKTVDYVIGPSKSLPIKCD